MADCILTPPEYRRKTIILPGVGWAGFRPKTVREDYSPLLL
jgi:hypothetical protein